MAFAVTAALFYGEDASEAVSSQAEQMVVFEITGTTADVDMDIGDPAGVFWTDVANATLLSYWSGALSNSARLENMYSFELAKNFVPAGGGAIGAGKVKFNGTALAPEILLNASEGLTAYSLCFRLLLCNQARVIKYSYGNINP